MKTKPTNGDTEIAPWIKNDAKAQELLVTRMEEGPLTHILSCETSNEMWSKLKSVYDKESVVSVHLLQQKFFLMDFGNESISSYISKIEEIKNKLKQAGETSSDKMIITKILMSLPDKNKHFTSAWESVSEDKQTLEELTSRLLIEEERAMSLERDTALAASTSKMKDSMQKGGGKPTVKCNYCHKGGHYARNCFKKKAKIEMKNCTHCKKAGHETENCWFRKGREENRTDKRNKSPVSNAFVGYSENFNADDWCMDTGASEHMCWNDTFFENISIVKKIRKLKVGDGNLLNVEGYGTVKLWAFNGTKLLKTTLSNVLYVPELKFNLFSVGCALDKGFHMVSESNKCEIMDNEGHVCAVAYRNNKLYKMDFIRENSETYSRANPFCMIEHTRGDYDGSGDITCAVETVKNISLWHNILAHQNIQHLKRFLKCNDVSFIDDEKDFVCEKCLSGKQHRMPHPVNKKNEQDLAPEEEAEAIVQLENFEKHEDIDHDQDLDDEVLDETRLQRYNFRQNRRQPRRFDDYELGADESLLTYMCETDRSTPIHRPPEDEDSFPVIHERELHSLHRNIPALRRRDVDTAKIKQHYYPEGGWGWLVCGAAFLAHLLTSGLQLAYGLLYLYTMKFLLKKHQDKEIYIIGGGEYVFKIFQK
ncbi:hypothetical protein JTB14_003910 [Gonioctena quinquepunctata]|nr:hypothetical protein JTB14_003910 [Gonioctena quinquepunctata]